jgi:hypothetical protein
MAGPLGALQVGPAAATTKVEEDVDSTPLGALLASPTTATTEFEEDVDGGVP